MLESGDETQRSSLSVRPCGRDDLPIMLSIIEAAAQAYRGVIPADCWHEPYMSARELQSEIEAGVVFRGCRIDGALVGVMGMQAVRNVDLIRHAYVVPAHQGRGVGGALMADFRARRSRQVLVGAWTAATWAIGFYRAHGFRLVSEDVKTTLLETYWKVSRRQIETSSVLAEPSLADARASDLVRDAETSSPKRT